jgi:hypothetical protein
MDIDSLDTSKLDAKQKARFDKMLAEIAETKRKVLKLVERADKQKRSDRTAKLIQLGSLIDKKLVEGDPEIARIYAALLEEIPEKKRYLFREKWPKAERPPQAGAKAKETNLPAQQAAATNPKAAADRLAETLSDVGEEEFAAEFEKLRHAGRAAARNPPPVAQGESA